MRRRGVSPFFAFLLHAAPRQKYEPPPPTTLGKKKKKRKGPDAASKLPEVNPHTKVRRRGAALGAVSEAPRAQPQCKLRLLKLNRVKVGTLGALPLGSSALCRTTCCWSRSTSSTSSASSLRRRRTRRRGRRLWALQVFTRAWFDGSFWPGRRSARDAHGGGNAGGEGRASVCVAWRPTVDHQEIIDDNHAIVSSSAGSEYYVTMLSFVDKDQLEPNCSVSAAQQARPPPFDGARTQVLLHNKVLSVVGILADDGGQAALRRARPFLLTRLAHQRTPWSA